MSQTRTIKEIKEEKRNLDFERSRIVEEIKKLEKEEVRALLKESEQELLNLQEKEGKLDSLDISVFLNELAIKFSDIYKK